MRLKTNYDNATVVADITGVFWSAYVTVTVKCCRQSQVFGVINNKDYYSDDTHKSLKFWARLLSTIIISGEWTRPLLVPCSPAKDSLSSKYSSICLGIFRPHHSTRYIDAAYCYWLNSVVCWSVCHSSEPAKTAQQIQIPFGLRTWVGPRNHVLDGSLDLRGKGQFWGGSGGPL